LGSYNWALLQMKNTKKKRKDQAFKIRRINIINPHVSSSSSNASAQADEKKWNANL
jgi:hypothetical protein